MYLHAFAQSLSVVIDLIEHKQVSTSFYVSNLKAAIQALAIFVYECVSCLVTLESERAFKLFSTSELVVQRCMLSIIKRTFILLCSVAKIDRFKSRVVHLELFLWF